MQENDEEKLQKLRDLSPEERRNLVGFFALLLKVDKRVNPSLYIKKQSQAYVGHDKSAYPSE